MTPVCLADDSQSWSQFRSLYDSGKSDEALQVLLRSPGKDASYYYNVGTLYLKTQHPGMAVPYLEKAFHLKPMDGDIRHNLATARTALTRLIGTERQDPGSTPLDNLGDQLSLLPTRATLSLLACALLLFSARVYAKSRSVRRWTLQGLGPIGLLIFAAALLAGVAPHLLGFHPAGFAVEHQSLRSGPGDQFLELRQVDAGTKLRLLDLAPGTAPQAGTDGGLWYQVRISGDGVAWAKASRLLIL